MTETFVLGGDPSAIRGSAQQWANFASAATGAAADVGSLDSSEFVGDEGDTYRGRVNSDLTPHLKTTGEAWSKVSAALLEYAATLEDLQGQTNTLRVQAGHQQAAVQQASSAAADARAADAAHAQQRETDGKALKPGQTLPPSTYVPQAGSANANLTNAQNAIAQTQAAATHVRVLHTAAVGRCTSAIDRAKDMRFQKPPGFWDKVAGVAGDVWNAAKAGVSWAAQHIGPVLKIISAVAGVLALVPFLAPVMGPIALVAGGAALLLDVANKLMNGQGSWLQIGIDALGLVPGIKPLTTMGKLGKLKAAEELAATTSKGLDRASEALALAKNAKRGLPFTKTAKAFKAGVNDAKVTLKAAKATNKVAARAETQLVGHYKKIDNAWKGVELVTTTGTAGIAGYKNYTETGSWQQALLAGGVSALGTKIPGVSKKFTAVQNVVANGAATTYQGVQLALDPKKRNDPMQWVKLGASGAKTVMHGTNAVLYRNAGTHPNGSERKAFETPSYWG